MWKCIITCKSHHLHNNTSTVTTPSVPGFQDSRVTTVVYQDFDGANSSIITKVALPEEELSQFCKC